MKRAFTRTQGNFHTPFGIEYRGLCILVGSNPFPVGARVVRGGWGGLYGRPASPYRMEAHREREYMIIREAQTAVQQELARHHDAMIQFLRDLVAIPSFDSQVDPVDDAVGARMSDLGF